MFRIHHRLPHVLHVLCGVFDEILPNHANDLQTIFNDFGTAAAPARSSGLPGKVEK
jgi:hypothetical protein